MVKIAIIGYGYWGPNLARNVKYAAGGTLAAIVDPDEDQRGRAQRDFPEVPVLEDWSAVLNMSVDAVCIATPASSHFEIARTALELGKHVLVEKPMTSRLAEAQQLVHLAQDLDRVLMVDHVYLYTPAIRTLKAMVESGDLGRLRFLDSTRINLGLFQSDIDVLWDLGPHDISIANHLFTTQPIAVQTTGFADNPLGLASTAYLTIYYPHNRRAHVRLSWESPVKIRQMLVSGDEKMVIYNDLEATEKIKVYDAGYEILNSSDRNRWLVDYRTGDIFIPKLAQTEGLSHLINDFVRCITTGAQPLSDGRQGLDIVKILTAATTSMQQQGEKVSLEQL